MHDIVNIVVGIIIGTALGLKIGIVAMKRKWIRAWEEFARTPL